MAIHEEYFWRDPFDLLDCGPVLLSDQIHFLAEEIGLIDPFDTKHLRPASYDLRVGNAYYVNDDPKELNPKANKIEIPPNGLVYVRTNEKFRIPYYLVARYSLRVHQVYRGLLIDNGLHIDPGYCGHIWIPVHNFTTQPRVLLLGHEFISVEFNRTTRLPGAVNTIKSEDELVSSGINNQLIGSNGRAIKVFYKDHEHYRRRHDEITPHYFWDKFPGEKHESAMLAVEQRLDKVKDDVETTVKKFRDEIRNFGVIGFVGAVLAILGTVFAVSLPFVYNQFAKSRETEAQHAAEIDQLRRRLQEQQGRIDAVPSQAVRVQGAAPPPGQKRK